jgi:hypothetical protein
MKTIRIQKMFAVASLTLATAAFVTFTFAASGQYKAVGDDGIAASPKVRQALNQCRRSNSPSQGRGDSRRCNKSGGQTRMRRLRQQLERRWRGQRQTQCCDPQMHGERRK